MAPHIESKFWSLPLEKTHNLYGAIPPEGPSNQGGPFNPGGPSIAGEGLMTGKEFFPGPNVTGYNSVFSKQIKTKLFIFFQFNEIDCLLHFSFVVTNGRCQS